MDYVVFGPSGITFRTNSPTAFDDPTPHEQLGDVKAYVMALRHRMNRVTRNGTIPQAADESL